MDLQEVGFGDIDWVELPSSGAYNAMLYAVINSLFMSVVYQSYFTYTIQLRKPAKYLHGRRGPG
jgi:hypothetical protein